VFANGLLLALLLGLGVSHLDGAAFPTSTFNCRANSNACVGGATITQLPAVNGLAGIKMFPNEPQVFTSSGPCVDENDCILELAVLELGVIGPFSGNYAAGLTIPLSWDFNIALTGDGSVRRWDFNAGISGPGSQLTSVSRTGSGTGPVSGQADLQSFGLLDGVNYVIYSQILVYWTGFSLTIDVPSNSIDFGASPSADIPEPGSLALAAGGLALLGLCKRRR